MPGTVWRFCGPGQLLGMLQRTGGELHSAADALTPARSVCGLCADKHESAAHTAACCDGATSDQPGWLEQM